MEVKKPTRKPRSFIRRFAAPAGVAVALLAGGGWGVYHYLHMSTPSEGHKDLADFEKAHSASQASQSATDELKNLFTSAPAKEENAVAKESARDLKSDRYSLAATTPSQPFAPAPELPPAVAETSASPAPSTLGDRYASVPGSLGGSTLEDSTIAPAEKIAPLEDADATVMEDDDIARGQEPEINPLRANRAAPEVNNNEVNNNFDAQAAFGQAPGAAALVASPSTPPTPGALPPQGFAANGNGRYQGGEPTLAEPPSAGFSNTEPGNAMREPAPAFGIKTTPPASPQVSPISEAYTATPLVAQADPNQAGLTPTPGISNRPGTGRPGEQLLEGVQSASISIEKLAPQEIQVGKRCTFAIRVRNTGQRTAQNVQIRDEIPLGTELVGTAPHATTSGSQLVWELGSLSVGEERLVEMELIPTDEREIGSVATVTIAAQASAKAHCTRPELALRLSSKSQVLVGQQQLVQVEISNPGSGDATGVILLETIPTGVSHEAGPALEFEVGTLEAGETRRMELILTAEQAGQIVNKMTARADANLRVEATCEFEVLAPDLKLSVDGPKRRYLERPATYRVSINNPGTATATDIQLTTKLPKGLQFVGADNLGEYDSATHSVQWSLAELPANERGVVELTALPIEAGEQVLQVSTSAHQGLEDRTEKLVLVEGLTALSFEVTDVEGLIEVGGETTYDIVVTNQGSKAATNVQIVAVMPAGLRVLSGQGDSQHTIQGERIIFSPLPQLAPKAEAAFRIQAQGTRPGDQLVRVMIQSDDLQQPITKEVSTRVYADE